MQLKSILNLVEKQKGFVYSEIEWADSDELAIWVTLNPQGRSKPICSGCGKKRSYYDRPDEREFQFIPLWGIPVFFYYAIRRVNCPDCGVLVESTLASLKFNDKINPVRATEAKQMKADGEEPVLKDARWSLLKRPENLMDKQTVKLNELLQYNLRSVRAYLMRKDFQRFWTYRSPRWAGKFLDEWCTRAMRSKIEPMKQMAKTLRKHRELLLNWFAADGELSSGSVEGMNSKAKLAMKKAYGFKSNETIEIALDHQLAELPDPKLTHRFC